MFYAVMLLVHPPTQLIIAGPLPASEKREREEDVKEVVIIAMLACAEMGCGANFNNILNMVCSTYMLFLF
jgi:hypothetical protein